MLGRVRDAPGKAPAYVNEALGYILAATESYNQLPNLRSDDSQHEQLPLWKPGPSALFEDLPL